MTLCVVIPGVKKFKDVLEFSADEAVHDGNLSMYKGSIDIVKLFNSNVSTPSIRPGKDSAKTALFA